MFFDHPVVMDATLRAQMDAFKNRDAAGPWAWFVQSTRRVSEHDFEILANGVTLGEE